MTIGSMEPSAAFGPIDGRTVFAGTQVSGGTLNVAIHESTRETFLSTYPTAKADVPQKTPHDAVNPSRLFFSCSTLTLLSAMLYPHGYVTTSISRAVVPRLSGWVALGMVSIAL